MFQIKKKDLEKKTTVGKEFHRLETYKQLQQFLHACCNVKEGYTFGFYNQLLEWIISSCSYSQPRTTSPLSCFQCSNAMVKNKNSVDMTQSENFIVSQWCTTYEVAQQDTTVS